MPQLHKHFNVIRNLQSAVYAQEILVSFFPENRYGPKNFGVTAFSIAHAKSLVIEGLGQLGWKQFSDAEN